MDGSDDDPRGGKGVKKPRHHSRDESSTQYAVYNSSTVNGGLARSSKYGVQP